MPKIYTKVGDGGSTSLFDGTKVQKNDPRVGAYGDVDELNATVGLMTAHAACPEDERHDLLRIQHDLFALGAQLANPQKKKQKEKADFHEDRVVALEQAIDRMELTLTPMRSFILPGGHPLSALAHLARTVCRRAERSIVFLQRIVPLDALYIRYINRLSDYFFVLARWFNSINQIDDVPWEG